MTSRERLLNTIRRQAVDHAPLCCPVFGLRPPPSLRWNANGKPVECWFSGRYEHVHTFARPWSFDDECRRAKAWLGLGVDDVLDISVPWGRSPRVVVADSTEVAVVGDKECLLMVREYQTPDGPLRHVVSVDERSAAPCAPVQAQTVSLFDDLNLACTVQQVVGEAEDVPKARWLYQGPDREQRAELAARMQAAEAFAAEHGLALQAWCAFGADALVWFAGQEDAVMLCLEDNAAFDALLDAIHAADKARCAAALEHGIDIVCQRSRFCSTDCWSPEVFRRHFQPRLAELAAMAHARGKLFALATGPGLAPIAGDLKEAGVDLLSAAGPATDFADPADLKALAAAGLAVAGGVAGSAMLGPGKSGDIRNAVRQALAAFGRDGGLVLSPVDALSPDTPWENVEALLDAWRTQR